MFGLEALAGKATAILGGILGLLALLLGAFFKGKRAERQKAELEATKRAVEALEWKAGGGRDPDAGRLRGEGKRISLPGEDTDPKG